MPAFQLTSGKLFQIKEKKIDLEKDVQGLTEKNLEAIFGLQFISTEFHIENFWIDTLAFDPQANSFVIIEYKRDQSFSVIDQGISYLNTVLRNKAELVLEYNEKTGKSLNRTTVDWNQIRVMFIAQRFTAHQQNAIGFRDFPIELWEVKQYENNIVFFNQIKAPEVKETIANLTKNKIVRDVAQQIKEYTFEDHLKKASDQIKPLLKEIRERIFALDTSIKEKPVRNYLGYKLNWYNFVTVHIYQQKIRIYVRKTILESDKNKRFKKVPESWAWGKTPIWFTEFSETKDLDYMMSSIKESYEAAPDK
ncbi:hypothetical protein A2W45_01680 [Candidatus Curtissbacteria bacterium RIFCSPHIGHO2_12_41_11]|uniref:DUF5655 domain-containing protein n=3 Tax=Candidatus Curtissiibacteriota TaxID=1752717 RepID=A0A1F5HQR6_9BACT|nr:MAG: hypothetical protein UU56_C0001G0003 [Candidatus Curtissbacteria bacterium GW2011_GWA2_41_24]OGD98077.1 MAG: hypothetical protein A2W45_01680 [Candidatus Curtissbacteria bacterium RIFCSPHIGHO2_12_41_11]OGE06309.1 MAG: hypothetical protein A2W70_03670 [Candidatus Curtissbacteria bacterium RIFCSPLOWO2_02_41_11]